METVIIVGDSYEHLDCSVIALAGATGMPYPKAHAVMAKAGRKDRHKMNTPRLIRLMNSDPSFRLVCRSGTVGKFIKKFPQGRYYVRISGHAFAIIDGVAHDTEARRPLERIKHAWRYQP